MAGRAHHQEAYILHTRPYSESSLLIDAFSRRYGRIGLLAKGARRIKSKVRGLIRPFQPLLLSWSGKGELQTLTAAESNTQITGMNRHSWLCACYMNELLIRFMHRHDPHEVLFDQYEVALNLLKTTRRRQIVLRIFEKHLLSESGYGLLLTHEVDSELPVQENSVYHYYPDRGPILAGTNQSDSVWCVDGSTLIALQTEKFTTSQQVEQSKRLLRSLLNHCMQSKSLKSREVFQQIHMLS